MSVQLAAFLLGILEGLTEFIPVSSTGHMIVAEALLKFETLMGSADKAELFTVVIQLGAILAVGFLFRQRLIASLTAASTNTAPGRLRTHLAVAFLPAAIIGFLFHKQIKLLLDPRVVAVALIVGGIVIIVVETLLKNQRRTTTLDTMTMKDALIVGFSQVLSLIPGTSRSAATIMGGMLGGMSRQSATEFSFMLSFPIMVAASLFEIWHYHHLLAKDMVTVLAIGFIVAFLVSLAIVAWLVRFVQRHTFLGFGIYRIILGMLVLAYFYW